MFGRLTRLTDMITERCGCCEVYVHVGYCETELCNMDLYRPSKACCTLDSDNKRIPEGKERDDIILCFRDPCSSTCR